MYFDTILLIMSLIYTIWNWNIALNGKTNLEESKGLFKPRNLKKDEEENIYDPDDMLEIHYDKLAQFLKVHKLSKWRENLFIIFGTWSYLKAILIPYERILPLRGLEWSFIDQTDEKSQLEMT